jgi:hypothetical protein
MKKLLILLPAAATLIASACSGDSSTSDGGTDATPDITTADVGQPDVKQADASSDVTTDVGDGGCPASWTMLPTVPASLDVPDGGGVILLHAAGVGTQNYTCEATTTDAGTTYAWTFVGPAAQLEDCASNVIGHHFASEAGASAPEWMTVDTSYVIGKKLVAYTPDGGAASVPWLLLQEVSSGGTGPIASTLYVQRLFTDGGVAPTTTCDSTTVGNSTDEPYTADYYFYGN